MAWCSEVSCLCSLLTFVYFGPTDPALFNGPDSRGSPSVQSPGPCREPRGPGPSTSDRTGPARAEAANRAQARPHPSRLPRILTRIFFAPVFVLRLVSSPPLVHPFPPPQTPAPACLPRPAVYPVAFLSKPYSFVLLTRFSI